MTFCLKTAFKSQELQDYAAETGQQGVLVHADNILQWYVGSLMCY